ncbi:M20/M25/M40 family metallo-hydrolase [Isachenkonia alkalipeptolytica]|uniref:M20/M25/M40 family metallo-hydrolase n=2 Tax=Isachenkonia alkalipeptolytica TaxID=2565777 RepID=A0AA43XLI1_9CLOT|nr:M20/M25/M40 family metallo-hydrolase [Isachenkonia alkalipeptolytica]
MYTYIVKCSDGTYYTGWTTDLEKRLNTHNQQKGAKYTRPRLPVHLVYWEYFKSKRRAQGREWEIKQLSRKGKEILINKNLKSEGDVSMEKTLRYTIDELEKILKIPSPSGHTEYLKDHVIKELKSLKVDYQETHKGAIIATVKGEVTKEHRTVSAHMDTLGAMVKEIKSNGRLKFDPIGGYMMNSVEGENCVIETLNQKQFSGTFFTTKPSVHIHSDAKKIDRSVENMEVIIDQKVTSVEDIEKLGISIGDFIFLDPRTEIHENGFIKSRHIDDKAGVAVMLGLIYDLKKNKKKPFYSTHFFFSNYEEVGHGASASIPEETKEFLAIDMSTPGDGQSSTEYHVTICAKDSTGPYDYSLRKKLIEIAKEHKINYKVDLYPYYGSDASAALRSGNDFKAALIGPGVYASHGYERTHEDAIGNTLKLGIQYLLSE